MSTKDNELTLEALAYRLEALERDNEQMRSENDELRHKVAYLEGSGTSGVEEAAIELDVPASLLGKNSAGGGTGVKGEGATGVWGSSSVAGHGGVYGQHTGLLGFGVIGDGKGSGAGVLGRNSSGFGVTAEGLSGVKGVGKTGVRGESNVAGFVGVMGSNSTGSGVGVHGLGAGSYPAIYGLTSGSGPGVLGESGNGYGGQFQGGKAQLMLTPAGGVGKPTTGEHIKGELYMDSAGALFVCTGAGTPGNWQKVTTTAA